MSTGGERFAERREPAARARRARAAALVAVFALGSGAALLVVGRIALPFRNPHGVLGPLVERRFDPGTNVLRFLVVVGAPLALLALVSLSRRARALLVARAEAPREQAVERGRARAWIPLALLAYALLCGLAAHTYHAEGMFDPFHDGEALGLATSLAQGGDPYADVAVPHGVIQDPLRAQVAFRLFGRSIGALRTLESLVKILTYGLIALLFLRLRPRQPAFAFAALGILTLATCAPEAQQPGLIVAPRDVLPVTFLLLALGLLRGIATDRERTSALRAAGLAALVPLTFGYSVDRGYFVLVLWVSVLGLAVLQSGRASRLCAASAAGLAAGLGTLALLLGAGRAGFLENALVHNPELLGLSAGIEYDWSRLVYVAPALALAALAFWTCARLLARVLWLGPLGGLRRLVSDDPAALLLVLAALVFYRGALLRSDAEHVRYSLWPALVCGLYLGQRALEASGALPARALRRLTVLASLACALLLAVHVERHGRLAATFPLGAPDERFLLASQRALLAALEAELTADDVFATVTFEPGWYYLLDRPAPTRFAQPSLALSAEQRGELQGDLERGGVTVVLARTADSGAMDRYPDRRRLPEAHAFLERAFVQVFELGQHRILRRLQDGER